MNIELVADPTPRSLPLKTADDVRVEMAKVYRAMKGGSMPSQDGTRLVYVLSAIAKAIEVHEIERRMQKLEAIEEQRRLSR